jgi:hypothetical protein
MAGPPWIDPTRQHGLEARDGDVWISAPAKSGTNWMMNIVHQLHSGGDDSFESIYHVVPWPEFVERPGQSAPEVHDRVAALPRDRRRAFKSHAAPPDLPFFRAGGDKDVKYVVVCRNPEEALVSFKVFLDQHTDAFFGLWQVPRGALTRPSFAEFYAEVFAPRQMAGMFFGFAAAWWALRHEPNVLMLHFTDMAKDLQGATRKVAAFLGIEPTPAQWAKVNEHASFAWMKKHESKFETVIGAPVQVLETGAMIRKGQTGKQHEDGMTPQIAADLRAAGSRILSEPGALAWLYGGGALP